MKKCPVCGAETDEAKRFCDKCQASMDSDAQWTIIPAVLYGFGILIILGGLAFTIALWPESGVGSLLVFAGGGFFGSLLFVLGRALKCLELITEKYLRR